MLVFGRASVVLRSGPALLLTSDAGSFITGHVVFADGGMVPR